MSHVTHNGLKVQVNRVDIDLVNLALILNVLITMMPSLLLIVDHDSEDSEYLEGIQTGMIYLRRVGVFYTLPTLPQFPVSSKSNNAMLQQKNAQLISSRSKLLHDFSEQNKVHICVKKHDYRVLAIFDKRKLGP